MKKPTLTASDRIIKRAQASGRGSVFTPSDFVDIAGRASVDQSLSRLVKAGRLRRLSRGLYDLPKIHPKLGALAPSPDVVAHALARETGSVVQIAGARAANALGLSTQVPAKNTYLTDGPARRVILGKRVIDLRHASPKHLVAPGSAAGTVVQALRHLGPPRATEVVDVASQQLSIGDKKLLGKTLGQAPTWMRPTLLKIAQGTSRQAHG
jgi:Family of unknown function (DUF6088)